MGLRRIRRGAWCFGLAGMLFAGIPISVLLPVQAQTQEQSATSRNAIDAAYKAESQAHIRLDVEAAMEHMTQDFKSIDKKGKVTSREEYRETMAFVLEHAESIQSNTVIERFALYGNRASVHIKTHVKGHMPGNDKKIHVFITTVRSRDVWVRQENRWMLTRNEEISSYLTIDGKPEHSG